MYMHPGAGEGCHLAAPSPAHASRAGILWSGLVQLIENAESSLPEMKEWSDPDYLQVFPNSVSMTASAGRQIEGFLDVSHFAFVDIEIVR